MKLVSGRLILTLFLSLIHLSVTAYTDGDFEGYLQFEHLLDGDDPETPYIGAVTAFDQDQYGFMWIGGESGLIRYDGKDFKSFSADLAGPRVNDILAHSNGKIYIATNGGVSEYDYTHGQFINVTEQAGGPVRLTLSLYELDDRILMGTEQGLFVLNDRSEISFVESQLIGDHPVHDILETNHGEIWLATRGAGIPILTPDLTDRRAITSLKTESGSVSVLYVERLKKNKVASVWVATTDSGVFRYTIRDGSVLRLHANAVNPRHRLSGDIARDIAIDTNGNILIAVDHGGLNVFDPSADKVYFHGNNINDPKSLIGNQMLSVFVDKQQDVWVGHFPEGISYFDRQKKIFKIVRHDKSNLNSISNDGILSLLIESKDKVWVGTEDGLNKYSMEDKAAKRFLHDPNDDRTMAYKVATDILRHSSGELWVANWNGGVNLYESESKTFKRFLQSNKKGGLSSRFAWCLEEDADGNIWIGTTEFGGINILNRNTMTFSQLSNIRGDTTSLSNNNINAILRDSDGHMWVGTNDGLNRFDSSRNEFTRFFSDPEDSASLSGNNVRVIYEDIEGDLWFGTEGRGVSVFRRKTQAFTRVSFEGETRLDTVSSIVQDRLGYLWFGTSNGVVRYDKYSGRYRRITERDGLAGDLHNRNAAAIDSNGMIIFGSTRGLSIFDTSVVNNSPQEDALHITSFIGHEGGQEAGTLVPSFIDLNIHRQVTLSHTVNYFDISFALMNFRASKMTNYSYKLEGFDKTWVNSQYRNDATYTNLDPGKYIFHVRVKKGSDDWQTFSDTLTIHVLPAPWATWWAWSLYVLVGIGLIAFFVWTYIATIKHERRAELLAKEREIVHGLENLGKIKDEMLNTTAHELRAPLNGMVALTELLDSEIRPDLSIKQSEMIDLVMSEGRALAESINDILDYQKLGFGEIQLRYEALDIVSLIEERVQLLSPLAEQKSLVLSTTIQGSHPRVVADRTKTKQVLTNLITNAIKYTDQGRITIGCNDHTNKLAVYVEDTGIGIPESEVPYIFEEFRQVENDGRGSGGTGLGLSVTKKLVEKMRGTIECHSKLGTGSRFTVVFPTDRRSESRERISTTEGDQILKPIKDLGIPVLIVDDDPTQSLITRSVLEKRGFLVRTETDGESALVHVRKNPTYKAIISDLNMPGISGIELCQLIRMEVPMKNVPFVLITSQKIDSKLNAQCRQAGVSEAFNKPVDLSKFGDQVLSLINHNTSLPDVSSEQKYGS